MKRAAETMSQQQLKQARALAMKLAEGVKRPIPGSVSQAAAATATAAQPSSAKAAPSASVAPGAEAVPSATPAATSALAQPIEKAQVAEIQRYLARLKFDPGPANGVLTDKTTEAIRQYQTDRKLKVDGEASRALLFHLKAEIERLQKP